MPGKIISVWSPNGRNGKTTVSILLSHILENSVYVDFDIKTPAAHLFFNTQDSIHSIDSIMPFIIEGDLNEEVIRNNIQRKVKCEYLRGTVSPLKSGVFNTENVFTLLQLLREIYDYVIVDTYSSMDNVVTFTVLKNADYVINLFKQDASCLKHFESIKDIFNGIVQEKVITAVNCFNSKIWLSKGDISEFLKMSKELIFWLPDMGISAINALNSGQFIEFVTKDGKANEFYKAVSRMVELSIFGVTENVEKTKPTILSFFSKKENRGLINEC